MILPEPTTSQIISAMAASRTRTLLLVTGISIAAALAYLYLGSDRRRSTPDAPHPDERPVVRTDPGRGLATAAPVAGPHVLVRGTVRDLLTGHGVADMEIALSPMAATPTASAQPSSKRPWSNTTTDADGRYRVTVPPGRYRVTLSGPALPTQPDLNLVLPRTVGERIVDIQVLRMASIDGRVVDQDGQPLADIAIGYRSGDRDARTDAARSDRDGGFRILVPPGPIQLIASTANRPESHTHLPLVAPGARLSGVEIVMDAGAQIAGQVVDASGVPVAGATVRARADDQHAERTASTSADGRFTLAALRPGHIVVLASAPGLAPSSPAVVQLEPGAGIDELRLVLGLAVDIRGRVIDDTGRPRAHVAVRAESALSGPQPVQARTNDSGEFTIPGLAEAPYVLIAEGPGIASARIPGITAPARDVEIVVDRTGAVAGRVTDGQGLPMADFWVRVDRRARADASAEETMIPRRGAEHRFVTDDGNYFIDGIRPGVYDVTFWAAGKAPRTETDVRIPAGGEAHASTQLGPGGIIRGTITDAGSGRPIRGATLRLSTGSEYPTLYTDDQGNFEIADIAPGRRSLEVSHPGYIGRIATGVTVRASTPEIVELALERLPFGAERTVEFAGIGAVLAMEGPILRVRQVIPNGPSEVAGLLAGDGITHTDGVATGDRTMAENIESIRGVVGTVVRVTVQRGEQHFNRDVVRASIRFMPDDLGATPPGNPQPSPEP